MDAITVSNLSKKYGSVLALNNVSLSVKSNKFFALLGPNGAGKTTLMRILTTQIDSTSGSAFVLEKNVKNESLSVRQIVSYVPQEVSVWTDVSGYENLLVYAKIYGIDPKIREQSILDVLKLMGLEEASNRLVNTYSGGMIRKLEIACAIMVKPKILFLDEPTIGLDPAARKSVWEKLKSIKEQNDLTVFFTTHYMDEADLYADEIAIINKGNIVTIGTPSSLKSSVSAEIIEIELSENDSIKNQDMKKLKQLDGVVSAHYSGNKLKIGAKDSSLSLNSILSFLFSKKIKIKRINTSKTTLDEVFLKYAAGSGSLSELQSIGELKRVRERIRG